MTILIWTDGYEIQTQYFKERQMAVDTMKKEYANARPDDNSEEWEELCYIDDSGAIGYNNGNDVFVWKIEEIENQKIEV